MKTRRKMPRLAPLALALAAALTPALAHAYEVRTVYYNDKPMLEFRIYDPDDGRYDLDEDEPGVSTFTINTNVRNALEDAGKYWAEVLAPGSNNGFAVPVYVGSFNDDNASCGSAPNDDEDPQNAYTGMQRAFINGKVPTDRPVINVGPVVSFDTVTDYPSTLSRNGDWWAILTHEIAHGLGITSVASNAKRQGSSDTFKIQYYGAFDHHLTDRFGTAITDATSITLADLDDEVTKEDGVFYVGKGAKSGVTFHGTNVDEVTGGKGIIIQGSEMGNDLNYAPDLSHLELERGMMSHQNYRNITIFMEAELAALQDLGYTIDRSRFFGRTVFSDDVTLQNTTGFTSSSTLGIGLHIYGKRANVTQLANLTPTGTGANAVRIDGSASTLTIPAGVTASANGSYGYGVLVAYGKDHVLNIAGTVEATGEGGYGIHLNFGNNLLGNGMEYRGSYIRLLNGNKTDADGDNYAISGVDEDTGFELNLDGPLVKQLNISGTVTGSKAAIYASENAYVKEINLLSGSAINGAIISDWDPENELLSNDAPSGLYTALNTGLSAPGVQDSAYSATINGSIQGASSINLTHYAGTLAITGSADVRSLENKGTLRLLGNASATTYLINDSGATLEMGFSPSGATNTITLGSDAVATLAGTLALRSGQGFYKDGATIDVASITGGTISGDFEQVKVVDLSPTLDFAVSRNHRYAPTITVERPEDAYSRHGRNASEASVGHALYHISSEATGDMQSLISAVDFSGSSAAVAQALSALAPTAYDFSGLAAFRDLSVVSSAITTHQYSRALASRLGLGDRSTLTAAEGVELTDSEGNALGTVERVQRTWFIMPYGDWMKQHGRGTTSSMTSLSGGVIGGVDFDCGDYLTWGVNLGLSMRDTKVSDTGSRVRSYGGFVGVHGRLSPIEWGGTYLFGQARLGLYENRSRRDVSVGGYERSARGNYSSLAVSAVLGAGYDFHLGSTDLGPVIFADYGHLHNGSFTEKGGDAASLKVRSANLDSLEVAIGGHAATLWQPDANITVRQDVGLGVKHEFLDRTYHTRASFVGYGAYSFTSHTDTGGRTAPYAQYTLGFENSKWGTFGDLTLGAERRSGSSTFNVGVQAGIRF
ncbi:MAG: autotransporter domain-containing protein [Succinivibrionaceae bacterium]|nr:autotransporter domain-containing protein [Succinivibrionaceae bacterium]